MNKSCFGVEKALENCCTLNLATSHRLELRKLVSNLVLAQISDRPHVKYGKYEEVQNALRNFKANVMHRKKQNDTITSKRLMEMPEPPVSEIALTAKVWDCAGIKSHDQRSRVLKKIDQQCVGYWVERRNGRTAVLHKGKNPNEITHE